METKNGSRRAFLGKVSVAGAALAAGGSALAATDEAVARTGEATEADGAHSVASPNSTARGRKATQARPGAPFSRAVEFNGVVFVAGVVGRAPGERGIASPDFETQCRRALTNLKASVEAAGSRMDRVLKCTCFLTDVKDFSVFNKVFRSFFPTSPPARSTVVVKELVVPGAKLEIDCATCLG